MRSVQQHYAEHLGPVYSWMAGGVEVALERGTGELDALRLPEAAGSLAIDLGAGFGMHAIPLARRGFSVVAIDSDSALLRELTVNAGSLPIRTVVEDLVHFRHHLTSSARVVLCMGDTLTHLSSVDEIQALFEEVAASLDKSGVFVLSFRDYRQPLVAERRFISVRSDAARILTCFLEYSSDHVRVHDLLHEREPTGWRLRVSTYRKLRLDPAWVIATLQASGLSVAQDVGLSGMIRLTARLAA
jgi:2-polyprenyl-3-methyl-5-hydroxy-6-metoxy-1,4-benzoquinol methylase